MQKHVRRLAKGHAVSTPITNFAARSFRSPTPYGNVLIMSPWNYPILLTIEPLIDALAAGNTAVVKPSAYSPETSAVLCRMLRETFGEEYVAVVTGGTRGIGAAITKGLLEGGATVFALYASNDAAADAFKASLGPLGERLSLFCCDVADYASVEAFFAEFDRRHDALDIAQPDVGWVGGITETMKIGAIAAAAGSGSSYST
jgi:3-oxoacyl-ACP reductase-like protein